MSVSPWAEANQGLGGWVGSVLTVVGLFAAWRLARAEYNRDKKGERARVSAEANLYLVVVNDFEALVQPFFQHARQNQGLGIVGFDNKVLNANAMGAARDLIHVPVLQWPSIAAYRHFRDFWFTSLELMKRQSLSLQPPLTKAELDDRDLARQSLIAELKQVAQSGQKR